MGHLIWKRKDDSLYLCTNVVKRGEMKVAKWLSKIFLMSVTIAYISYVPKVLCASRFHSVTLINFDSVELFIICQWNEIISLIHM